MTRMWLGVEPSELCDQHLLGEHKELHQEVGQLKAGNLASVLGHVKRAQFFLHEVHLRHVALVREMEERGINHDSELPNIDTLPSYWRVHEAADRVLGIVDREDVCAANREDLSRRCPDCSYRMHTGDAE